MIKILGRARALLLAAALLAPLPALAWENSCDPGGCATTQVWRVGDNVMALDVAVTPTETLGLLTGSYRLAPPDASVPVEVTVDGRPIQAGIARTSYAGFAIVLHVDDVLAVARGRVLVIDPPGDGGWVVSLDGARAAIERAADDVLEREPAAEPAVGVWHL